MNKLEPGHAMPDVTVSRLGGGELTLGKPLDGRDWQLVVVYRGKHCPICAKYLKTLEPLVSKYHAVGIDVITVSADSEEKAKAFIDELSVTTPVGFGLTLAQMNSLGVYVSDPRSAQETDRPFAEPAIFVVNEKAALQIVDISNAPLRAALIWKHF